MPTWDFYFTADSLGRWSAESPGRHPTLKSFCTVLSCFLCNSDLFAIVCFISCHGVSMLFVWVVVFPFHSIHCLRIETFDGELMPCFVGHFWNLPLIPMDDPHKDAWLNGIFILISYHCVSTWHHILSCWFISWDQIANQVSFATRLHQMSTVHTRIMTFIDSFMPEVPMKRRCLPWFQVAKEKNISHDGFLRSSDPPRIPSVVRQGSIYIWDIMAEVPSDSKLKGTPIDGETLGVHDCNQGLPWFPLLLPCLCPKSSSPVCKHNI